MSRPRKNLKIPEEDYQRHNERRQEMGLTWAEYIDGQAPTFETLSEEDVRRVVREEMEQQFREALGHRP